MKKYNRIRKSLFWIGIVVILFGAVFLYYKPEIHDWYVRTKGRENISYSEVKSELLNTEECYLCGVHERSMVDYYRGTDTVGVISLNDWYVLDFGLAEEPEEDSTYEQEGTKTWFGNTGYFQYQTERIKAQGIAEMQITLPKDYRLNTRIIREHLCQPCLEKILGTLEYDKWKEESKEAIPLCLIDFKTLEVYSIQEISQKYILDQCYVRIDNDEKVSSILVASYK